MQIDTKELMGIEEIAGYLGVKRQTVYQWQIRGILPAPDVELAHHRLYLHSTVHRWAQATGRIKA